jgi:hypothetical protein
MYLGIAPNKRGPVLPSVYGKILATFYVNLQEFPIQVYTFALN